MLLNPFLDFNCTNNNGVSVNLYHLCFRKVWVCQYKWN